MGGRGSGGQAKPTRLKVLSGNPGGRPLPKDEPVPEAGPAEMPVWLDPGARVVWDEYAPLVEGMGLLSRVDAEKFGRWCELAAEFRRAGSRMSAALIARMEKLESQFGLDPASRAQLGIWRDRSKKQANPFGELAG